MKPNRNTKNVWKVKTQLFQMDPNFLDLTIASVPFIWKYFKLIRARRIFVKIKKPNNHETQAWS